MEILYLIIGAVVGGICAWLALRSRSELALARLKAERDTAAATLEERLKGKEEQLGGLSAALAGRDAQLARLQEENASLGARVSELSTLIREERKAAEEKLAVLDSAQVKLSDAFKALSAEALQSNNRSFMELARTILEKFQDGARGDLEQRRQAIDELVKPLRESLDKVDGKIQELEKVRTTAYVSLAEQLKSLASTQAQLQGETANLVKALRTPTVRGRWGEIQLRRVAEIAGMVNYCDFVEQETATGPEGRLRPDMVVRLPNGKNVVVDSKAPLAAYLEALEADDEQVKLHKLKDHARHIRVHLGKLSAKSYWDQFKATPEFVVLFLPGETFFSAALEQDPLPHRIRRGAEGDPRHPHHADSPAPGSCVRLAAGAYRGECPGHQRPGEGPLRPGLGPRRSLRGPPKGAGAVGGVVQPRGRLTGVPGPGLGTPLQGAGLVHRQGHRDPDGHRHQAADYGFPRPLPGRRGNGGIVRPRFPASLLSRSSHGFSFRNGMIPQRRLCDSYAGNGENTWSESPFSSNQREKSERRIPGDTFRMETK